MSEEHDSDSLEREDFHNVTVLRLKTSQLLGDDAIRDLFEPVYLLPTIGRNCLVINFGAVEYLTSMTLGKLIMLNRKVQAANGRLALCHLSPMADEILEVTRLKPLFHIYATEQQALKSFSSKIQT